MRQEIDDPRRWRVSMSGFSIKTGWGDQQRTVAMFPGMIRPIDETMYQQWLNDAEAICERHNSALPEQEP
jgi:hypothetical protein